jgi:hypothetical protein
MQYTDEIMDQLRMEGDPILDKIVGEIFRTDQVGAVNDLLKKLINNKQTYPEALPDNTEYWLKETANCPIDIEWDRIQNATDFFKEHGIAISLLLGTSSLVYCYAAHIGVKALSFSYRLGQDAYRRISETGQFVLLVMAQGGLEPGGKGIKAVQKIRLMHSAIRHLIRGTGRWNEGELGVPIC